MNIAVTPTAETPAEPNIELPLAEARKAVEAETGRIPTGPRAGGSLALGWTATSRKGTRMSG